MVPLHAVMARIVIALIVLLATSLAQASTFAVEIAARGVPAWQADALAAALKADLGDHDFRAPAANQPPEIVVHGELSVGELRYQITSRRAPVIGVIELAGLDRAELAGVLRDHLHALVQ